MQPVWLIGIAVVVVGLIAFIVAAGRAQRKTWLARADALRALALRRNARVDESPADPSSLLPMRPFKDIENLRRIELPVVVRAQSSDVEYRLFDVHTDQVGQVSRNRTTRSTYDTYVTFTSSANWPRFEFVAIAEVAEDSLRGKLFNVAGAMAEHTRFKGMTHVAIPHRPGFQLFVADASQGPALSGALMKIFEHKIGWWIASLDHTVAFCKGPAAAPGMAALVPVVDLDAFLDEAIGLERTLRAALAHA